MSHIGVLPSSYINNNAVPIMRGCRICACKSAIFKILPARVASWVTTASPWLPWRYLQACLAHPIRRLNDRNTLSYSSAFIKFWVSTLALLRAYPSFCVWWDTLVFQNFLKRFPIFVFQKKKKKNEWNTGDQKVLPI